MASLALIMAGCQIGPVCAERMMAYRMEQGSGAESVWPPQPPPRCVTLISASADVGGQPSLLCCLWRTNVFLTEWNILPPPSRNRVWNGNFSAPMCVNITGVPEVKQQTVSCMLIACHTVRSWQEMWAQVWWKSDYKIKKWPYSNGIRLQELVGCHICVQIGHGAPIISSFPPNSAVVWSF